MTIEILNYPDKLNSVPPIVSPVRDTILVEQEMAISIFSPVRDEMLTEILTRYVKINVQ